MRTTQNALFPFDDSLVALNRRQKPLTQTDRGNYEWTWVQAILVAFGGGKLTPQKFTFVPGAELQMVMFGQDVPHTAWLASRNVDVPVIVQNLYACLSNLQTYINTTLGDWFTAAKAAVPVLPTEPADISLPLPSLVNLAAVSGVYQARRPTLFDGAAWNPIVDLGQGTLPIFKTPDAQAQGFPLVVEWPDVNQIGEANTLGDARLTVGYESAVNHGIGFSQVTGAGDDAQNSYTPVVLRLADYTQAIKDNGNVITIGADTYFVVGLYNFFVPGP